MLTLFPKVSYWGGGPGLGWFMYTELALTPIPGEGVNYPTPRAQFHANECKEGRDANPQPQERNSTPTSVELTHPNACIRALAYPYILAPGPPR